MMLSGNLGIFSGVGIGAFLTRQTFIYFYIFFAFFFYGQFLVADPLHPTGINPNNIFARIGLHIYVCQYL